VCLVKNLLEFSKMYPGYFLEIGYAGFVYTQQILHKVVWQHMQGVVGSLIATLLQILENIPVENFENWLRFDRIVAFLSLVCMQFFPPCML